MQRAAVVSVVVAVLLCVAALVAFRPRGGGGSAAPVRVLVGLESARVRTVEVRGDGVAATLTREETPAVWTMRLGDAPAVVVQDSAVRGAIRLLADLDALEGQGQDDPGAGGVDVLFALEDGSTRSVRIGGGALGGRVACRLSGEAGSKTVLAEANVAGLFRREALEAWGEGALVPSGAGRIAEVVVERDGARVRLVGARGRWGVVEPVASAGDMDACEALARALTGGGLRRIARDARELDPLATVFAVRVVTEARALAGESVEAVRVLHTLRGVDLGGGVVGAVVVAEDERGRVLWGPWAAEVPAEVHATIDANAGVYLSRVATTLTAADVAGVRVGAPGGSAWSARFARGVDGWRGADGAGGEGVVGGGDAAQVAALLALLCETRASAATTRVVEETARVARVALVVGELEAEVVEVGRGRLALRSGAEDVLLVRGRGVTRVYPWGAHEGLAGWLASRAR